MVHSMERLYNFGYIGLVNVKPEDKIRAACELTNSLTLHGDVSSSITENLQVDVWFKRSEFGHARKSLIKLVECISETREFAPVCIPPESSRPDITLDCDVAA